jgi:dipeptidyl aminopeptidase/acylaminoacyl peptidase
MLSRIGSAKRVALLSVAAVFVAGCAHADKEVSIAPLVPAAGRMDPGLGPGTRALSSGPGYKGSPNFSPGGDRIAYTVDGYVVDRPTDSEDLRRWTTRDFVAEDTEWISEDTLMILGTAPPPGAKKTPSSLYRARADQDSLELEKVEKEVSAIGPGRGGLIFSLDRGAFESGLALTRGSGDVRRLYSRSIKGRVASLSLSPDGDEAVLAVRPPGDFETSVLHVFDLRKGKGREITRLDGNQEILGTPQWTGQYLYFVAGEKDTPVDRDGSEPLYEIYRVPEEGGAPVPAPGVGEDFVAASIRVSPDGERLAVIGRLNPKSPTNLYVLEPRTKDLTAVTMNEDMEIKTGPDDLAWSPGGESVAVIARGTPSTEPEVRAAPADRLLRDFYNLYEVPVAGPEDAPR